METTPSIIFEDDALLIVNKPAGMIVNRADTSKSVVTLQDWVETVHSLQFTDGKIGEESSDFQKRSGIVHRLDKETSGLIIIAKDEETFIKLQKEFKEGIVEKTYIALCHGAIHPETGEIKVPIGRLPWNRMRFGVFPQGRESRTLYQVLKVEKFVSDKNEEEVSLVEVHPKTGRTHQIRVHFQYIGHPIFADSLYAGRKTMKKDRKYLSRHFLHAKHISFIHPTTGKQVEFDAPLTEELSVFLSTLK